MSNARKIFSESGAPMLSARKAARVLHCAPDYVGKLCREGKLDGARVKGAWYVDPHSIAQFQKFREEQRTSRAQELSVLRKSEGFEHKYAAHGWVGRTMLRLRALPLRGAALALCASMLLGGIASMSASVPRPEGPLAQNAALARVESPFFATLPSFDFGKLFSIFARKAPPQTAQTQTVAQAPFAALPSAPQVSSSTTTAPTTPRSGSVTQNTYPVVERLVERVVTEVVSGVSEDLLTRKLQELGNTLRSEIVKLSSGSTGAVVPYAPAFRIDKLSNVTATNLSVSGVSGLVAADIPALNY